MAVSMSDSEKFDDYVINFALRKAHGGQRIALITVIAIEGAAPRPLGAQMAVAQDGDWAGYLSGGCIEKAVIHEALAAIAEDKSRRLRYGKGSPFFDIQLPCGSAIELVIDVDVSLAEMSAVADAMLRRSTARLSVPDLKGSEFFRFYFPKRRLVIVGSSPSALFLMKASVVADFETVLYSHDPDTVHSAVKLDIPVKTIVGTGYDFEIRADNRTAIVFVHHDHDWERMLIPKALSTEAFYIGALGSHRTHQRRTDLLRRQGFTTSQIERIHGPAGIFPGGKSGPEVAISIIAEVMQTWRKTADSAQCLEMRRPLEVK